jgi:hypothetical protein
MQPIKIDGHWQIFLDDYLIARSTGFDKVVHHPQAKGVVIPADKPWETVGVGLQYVERKEDGTFLAFYNAMWWDAEANTHGIGDRAHAVSVGRAMATSTDGIHWDKPVLHLVDAPAGVDWSQAPFPAPKGTTRENNLGVPFILLANLHRSGNVSDPKKHYALRPAPDAADILSSHLQTTQGYFVPEIPDFLHDPDWSSKLIDSGGPFNPRRHMLHFWDDLHKEWVVIEQGVVGHWLPSREIGRFASKDLIHWTAQSVLYPDAHDSHTRERYDEPMGLVPFYSDGLVMGLLSWFHSDRTHPHGGPDLSDLSQPCGHPGHWPWCRKGTNEMRITLSRDGGKTWDRTSSREAWIHHGSEQDSYDRLVIGPTPMVRVGDEDWFYIGVVDSDHLNIRDEPNQASYYHQRLGKHQVALYTQKHNRYVSLTAKNFEEVLITNPVVFEGDTLQLNVDAGRGVVRVGIASAEPMPGYDGKAQLQAPHLRVKDLLPGFTFEDCLPIRTNSIEHTVEFKDGKSFRQLKGKPVYLMFQMVDADLYGFRAV